MSAPEELTEALLPIVVRHFGAFGAATRLAFADDLVAFVRAREAEALREEADVIRAVLATPPRGIVAALAWRIVAPSLGEVARQLYEHADRIEQGGPR